MAGVGESILGATVQLVVEKVGSDVIQQIADVLGFKQDLNKMKMTLKVIKSFLADAERQVEINGDDVLLKEWLAEFKSITYEANDVLDELEYKWLKQEVEGHTQVRKKISSLKTKTRYSSRIRETQNKMDHISTLAYQYRLQKLNVRARGNLEIAQERVTTSLMGDEKVIGRDNKKAEVIEQLMSEHEDVQVLAIYGIGGVGKTTLARYVYNDEVIWKHFELKIWVCVSDNFDVKRLTSEILKSVVIQSKKSNTRRSSEYISLDELQRALMEELTGKKFFLVLDDVWNEEQHKWDEFRKPFVTTGGISKRKILVTTRSEKVVEMMSPMKKQIELKGLSCDDFWDLFKRYAFDGLTLGSNDETLEKIGRKIVEKLKGSPLAVKTVGRLLKSDMSVKHWNNILDDELWKSSEEKNDIMPALRLSYQHLPGALKPCFAFLSLFPKDYLCKERMLKELWIANGFICPQGSMLLEDIATTYINTLLSMCMIQVDEYGDGNFVVVHDLLHDLAQIISKDEYLCLRHDEDLKNIPDNVRHLYISSEITSSKLNNFKSTFKNLRTLVVSDSSNNFSGCFNYKGLHGICIKAKHLRASVMSVKGVPESLSKCHFKHLRYLNLSPTDISCLPESLCTFYNLQALNIEFCRQLKEFPVGLIKLVNLRHIYTFGAKVSTSSIKNVGKLTSLQELCFHVSKEAGHRVTELENMNDIRKLKIKHLENVSSREEAMRARLNDKKHIVSLTLKWSPGIMNGIPYDEILCGLQPYMYLRNLKIYNYGGAKFPPWEEDENNKYLPTLQKFVLDTCLNLPTLKSLERSKLQHLAISHCPKLSFGSGFEGLDSLVYLSIFECPALLDDIVKQNWVLPSSLQELIIRLGPNSHLFTHDELIVFMSKSFEKLTSLTELTIGDLPHFTELKGETLQHMTSLKKLWIIDWTELVSVDIRTLTSLEWLRIWGYNKIKYLSGSILPPSLQDFGISNCAMMESMSDFGLLPSLSSLGLDGCSNLASLPENLNHLPSFEDLQVIRCPKIKSLPASDLPPSLRYLRLEGCSNLESLPENLNQLTSLGNLFILSCPKIKSFPADGLPPSLFELVIYKCPLLKESCQKDVGSDWPKISNIRKVVIDGKRITVGWR